MFEGCQSHHNSSHNSDIHTCTLHIGSMTSLGLMTSVDVHLVCRPWHFDGQCWTAFLISTSCRLSLALVLLVLSAVGRAPPIWGKFLTGPKVFDKRAEAIKILHAPASSWDARALTTYSTTHRKVADRNHACKVRGGQINKHGGWTNEQTGNNVEQEGT